MGFDIGGLLKSAVEVALPLAIEAFCPEAMAIPGVQNMLGEMFADGLCDLAGQVGDELGLPKSVTKEFQSLIKQTASQLKNPLDPGVADFVREKAGAAGKDLIDQMFSDYKDAWQNYKHDEKNKAQCGGGKGGAAGAGGIAGFRALMALLSEAQEKEFQTVGKKAQAVLDSLNDDSGSKESKQAQFTAMNESKTEGDIMQMISDMVSKVEKATADSEKAGAQG